MKNITLTMRQKIINKLAYIFLKVDSILLPLISSYVFMAWGFILALPFSTFETSQTYDAMAEIAPEWVWSVLLIILGLLQLFSTFRNASWQRQAIVNFICMFVWLVISVTIFLANPLTTGTGVYPMLAALCFGRFYRSFQDKEKL